MARHPAPSFEGGAPEWMVSYADMITIVMAFFVVLYSTTAGMVSEGQGDGQKAAAAEGRLKQVMDSLYDRFGPAYNFTNFWSGSPRNSRAVAGSPRDETDDSASNRVAPESVPVFSLMRGPKDRTAVDFGLIFFDPLSADVGDLQRKSLDKVCEIVRGKPQMIEVRGHSSRRPLPPNSPLRDPNGLSYARARAVRECLVSGGIDARRIRLAIGAEGEAYDVQDVDLQEKRASRVEIRILDEIARDLNGFNERAPGSPAAHPMKNTQSSEKPQPPEVEGPVPEEPDAGS